MRRAGAHAAAAAAAADQASAAAGGLLLLLQRHGCRSMPLLLLLRVHCQLW